MTHYNHTLEKITTGNTLKQLDFLLRPVVNLMVDKDGQLKVDKDGKALHHT